MDLISLFRENKIEEIKQYLQLETNSSDNFFNHDNMNELTYFYSLEELAVYLNELPKKDLSEICDLFFKKYHIQASNLTTEFLAKHEFHELYQYYMTHTDAKALWLMNVIQNKSHDSLFPYITAKNSFVDLETQNNLDNIIHQVDEMTTFENIYLQCEDLKFNEHGNKTLSYSENKDYFLLYLITHQDAVIPMSCISHNHYINEYDIDDIENRIECIQTRYHFKALQIDKSLNAKEALDKLEANIACVKEFFNLSDEEVGENLLSFTIHQNDTYIGQNHVNDNITSGVYALQAKAMLSSPAQRASTFLHEYTHFRQNLAFGNVEEFKHHFDDVYDTLKNYKNNQEEVVQLIIDSVKDKLHSTQEISYLVHRMLNENLAFNQIEVQLNHVIEQEILPSCQQSNVLFHIQTRLDSFHKDAIHSFETEFLHKLDNQNQNSCLSYWERADEVHARMNEAAFDFDSHYHSMFEFTKSAFEKTKPKLFAFNQLLIENYRFLKQKIENNNIPADSAIHIKRDFHI